MKIQQLVAALVAATFLTLSGAAQTAGRLEPSQQPDAPDAQFDGELEIEIEDADGGARVHHRLITAGRRLTLRFDGEAPYLVSGMRIRARGRLQNDTLLLASDPSSVQTLVPAAPNTFGEQRTIVILVNFRNNTSQPYSWSTAQQVTFQTVSAFFSENSYGQTWLTGDVFGWFTIPMDAPSSSCDYYTIATLAENAAVAAGADLSNYRRRVIAFPQSSGCGWWGVGNVGGTTTRAWVNGSYTLKVVAHEMGHNFGDYHSNSQPCSTGGCTAVEYGDDHDVMGNPSSGHMNAFQKERLGWLGYGSSPAIQTVSASGAYWVDTMTAAGTAPKALRILKSVDASGKRTWYYVEARSQSGFDSSISPGVLLHTGSEATGNSSFQIDLAPATTTFDRVLDVGQTYTDPAVGLSIATTSAGTSGAWVQVTYGGVQCVTTAPGLSLLPAATVSVGDGQAANYTVRVKNNDGAGCASTTFGLSASLSAGWSSAFGQSPIQIAPGGSTDVALTITPAAGAAGTTAFTAAASRQGSSGPGASVSGSVTVVTSLATSLQVLRSGPKYLLTATVQTGGSAVAGANVSFRITKPNGTMTTLTATTSATGQTSVAFKPNRKDPHGSYQVLATATYGGLTGTASGTFVY